MSNIKKNFLFSSVLSLSQIIFPIITFPYVTRVLLPQGLGSVNFIDSIVQYIMTISALGIPIYGVREISRVKTDKDKLSKTYSELLIIHSSLSILCSIIFGVFILTVTRLNTELQLCLVGIGIILSNVFLINWFFSGLEKFAFISTVSIVVRLITISGIFIFVKTIDDRLIYYALNLVGNVITGGICLYYAGKEVDFTFRFLQYKRHFKSLFLIFSLMVITNVYVLLDSVILGFLKDNKEVAYYTTSMKLSKIPIALLFALTSVLIPKLSVIEDKDEFKKILEKSCDVTFILSIPIAFGIFLLSPELISVFAGKLFDRSVGSLRILSFVIIPIGIALVNHQILLPFNREKYMMKCATAGMVVSLVFNFLLIPYLGSIGTAISSLLTEFIVCLLLYALSYKLCKIKIPLKLIFYSVTACMLFFVVKFLITSITQNIIIILISCFSICSILYFSILGFLFKVKIINEIYFKLLNKIKLRLNF